MKKIATFLLTLMVCFCLTGCGEKNNENTNNNNNGNNNNTTNDNKKSVLSCTKTETDEDGYITTDTMNITYQNNTISKIENINISEMDSDVLEASYSLSSVLATSLNEIDGLEVVYTKESNTSLKYTMTVDYDKLDLETLKETLGDLSDDSTFYSSKEVNLDKFKQNYLQGYTCK